MCVWGGGEGWGVFRAGRVVCFDRALKPFLKVGQHLQRRHSYLIQQVIRYLRYAICLYSVSISSSAASPPIPPYNAPLGAATQSNVPSLLLPIQTLKNRQYGYRINQTVNM